MSTSRKFIVDEDGDGVVFASGKFSVLNEGVTLSSPGRALQTANEREDVSLNVMGVIAATDDANG